MWCENRTPTSAPTGCTLDTRTVTCSQSDWCRPTHRKNDSLPDWMTPGPFAGQKIQNCAAQQKGDNTTQGTHGTQGT